MNGLIELTHRPRALGALCAAAATAAGLAYMSIAGAPTRYLLVNLGALMFGFIALAALGKAASRGHLSPGGVNLVLGLLLLAVGLFGASADGVTRWVTVGGLSIQPGLIVVPLMAVLFARSRDRLSLLGLAVAAAGLAIQPDRGTAGALAAGLLALALVQPHRNVVLAAVAALVGFGVTPGPARSLAGRALCRSDSVHRVGGPSGRGSGRAGGVGPVAGPGPGGATERNGGSGGLCRVRCALGGARRSGRARKLSDAAGRLRRQRDHRLSRQPDGLLAPRRCRRCACARRGNHGGRRPPAPSGDRPLSWRIYRLSWIGAPLNSSAHPRESGDPVLE